MRPKSGKSPKTITNEELVAARIKKHDLKRSLPPHDEVNTQPQKKRAMSPHVLLSLENILTVAVPQPAIANELFVLELPRAWDPTASSRALQPSESKRTQDCVLEGNKEEYLS